jgi:hypothetical protein
VTVRRVEITLAHPVEGAPECRALRLRLPTVGELIDAGEFARRTSKPDPKRPGWSLTAEAFDLDRFVDLVAGMAEVDPATVDVIDARDLPAIRRAVGAMVGDPKRAIEVAHELIFGLEWPPSEVERLTVDRLAHYYKAAVERAKKRRS